MKNTTPLPRRSLPQIISELAAAKESLRGLTLEMPVFFHWQALEQLSAQHVMAITVRAQSAQHENVGSALASVTQLARDIGLELAGANALLAAVAPTQELATARAVIEPLISKVAALEAEEAAERNSLADRRRDLAAKLAEAQAAALAKVEADPALAEIAADLKEAGY